MEGNEELHNVYEFIAICNSLPEKCFSFMIPGRFGPTIWGLSEAPFKSEVRESGVPSLQKDLQAAHELGRPG